MQRWMGAARRAADEVSSQAGLWLPGSLAWVATVGWLALLLGVGQPPSVAALTFVGAGIYTSGAWPWNAIGIVAAGIGMLAVAALLFALGEAVLVRGSRARPSDVVRTFALALACALPALVVLAGLGIVVVVVAPGEFNSPADAGGPVLRTAMRALPVLVALLVAVVGGAAFHAAASRAAARGRPTLAALGHAPRLLAAAGWPALVQPLAALLVRVTYVALVSILLRVLWSPIDGRLLSNGIDAATLLLLVGFVAIWLCLVLAGGAVHAWGTMAWTGVLGSTERDAWPSRQGMEMRGRT
jgi:hypothetical protein